MTSVEMRRDSGRVPFFSVCVPQYNRTSFVLEACRSLQAQTFASFEICISDDCSTDGRQDELIEFLNASGCSFVCRRQERNLRYDGNLRACIDLARGEYAFLLGNDDALAKPTTLEEVHSSIASAGPVSAVVTNFEDFTTGQVTRRVHGTRIVGAGPGVAARTFRNFSFVSGVLLRTSDARLHATDRWDGTEMYQMFLATRLIAAGGRLLYLDTIAIRKDIQIAGENIDSYARWPRVDPCPIEARHLPMGAISQLVADALAPYETPNQREHSIERIARQLYLFTYPYWIVEYRRVQSWRYAVGVCLGLRPRHSLAGLSLSRAAGVRLTLLFWASSLAALALPARVFSFLRESLYRVAKAAT